MTSPSKLERNIKLYFFSQFFEVLLFIIPIWFTFELQYLSVSQISLFAGLSYLITVILELPTGALADLWGRKTSCSLGYLISALALFMIGTATGAPQVIIGLLVSGVGSSLVSGSNLALAYDSLKQLNREDEFAEIRSKGVMAAQVGIIVSSLVAGYLFTIWKGLPYIMSGLSMLINVGIYFFMTEPHIDSQKFTWKSYIDQTKVGFQQLFKHKYIMHLSLFYTFFAGISWSWQVYFNQIFATEIGYSEIEKGWIFAVIRFINAFIVIKLLVKSGVFKGKPAFIRLFGLLLIASLPAFIPMKPLGTLLLFFMTLTSTLRFTVLDGLVNKEFDSRYRATAISALNMFTSLIYIALVFSSAVFVKFFPISYWYTFMGLLAVVFIFPQVKYVVKHSTTS